MKKKLYLQLALLCLSLLASLNVIYAQCPVSCTFTEANGPNINFSGNQTLCIGTNTGDLNINFNGSNNVICVAPGVTWTQTNGLNLSGVTINVYGTWVMNGGINANSASVINIYSGATFTTNSTGFGNNLTINNAGATTFTATGQISNAGNFVFNNTAGATLTATATSLFVVGNGNMVDNYGTMTFSNLENSEANLFYNRSTGFISIGRYFYNHGAFLNEGEVETICGPFGAVACEFIVGDKGPGKTFVNNSCFSVTGNVRFDGPATNNDEFEIINGNLTINKPVTGTNGRFIVTNGVSTINLAGSYAGTNLRICDQNTAGNGFDVVNNTPSSNLYTVDCSPNACTSVFEAQIAQLCDEGAPNEGTVLTVTANGAPSGNWVLRTFNNPGQVWASGANGDLVEATGVPIGTTVEVVDAVTSTSIATITNAGGATFLTIQDDDGTPASPEGGSNLGCQNELSCPPSGLFDLISNGLAGSYSSGNPGGIIGSRVLAGPHNGNFNAVIFGSFTNSDGTGDSEGRLAVQGNFSASGSYTIGGGAPTSTGGLHAPQGWDNLVVGGDVNHTSAFAGVRGNLLYNTATDLPPFSGGFSGIPGIYRQHAPDVNWSAAKSYFETISSTYSPANVTANCPSRQSGAVTDNGGGSFDLDAQNSSAVVVFDLSPFAGTLTSTPVFNFENVGNAASILLLYPGAAVTFAGGSISIDGATATAPYAGAEKDLIEKTLWNFYEATTFNFSAYAILGSVLAPFTTAVSLSGGQMNGQTILAGNITQSGGFEFHNFCFTGDLSSCVGCNITSAGAVATCDDNDTGTPTDDYFTLTTNPVGTGIGTQYNVTVVHNGITTNYGPYNYGAASVSFGNFLISQGNATVTITDATTGTCSLGPVTVNAPAACSTCNITSAGALATCNDNGTGTPADDYFTLTTNPVGTGVGTQYNVAVVHNGITTNYGPYNYGAASVSFGNFLISQGNATVTITDATTGTCSLGPVTVNAPAACSVCNITSAGAVATCDDNDTGTPTDDYFTLMTNPVGAGVGTQYNVTVVHNGNTTNYGPFSYGAASASFGNFLISQGNATVTITDATTGTCSLGPVPVTAPAACSICNITSAGAVATCDDNDTGTPTDDYFTLMTNPVGAGVGTQYNVTVVHNGNTTNYGPFSYGAASASFGNFLISQGNATVTITDATTGTCSLGPVPVTAPAACSICNITSAGAVATCDDNDTGISTDDYFTLTTNPVGAGVSTQYNVTVVHNGNTTNYGPFNYGAASASFGNFLISLGNATVTITDATTGTCSLGPISVNAPTVCSEALAVGNYVFMDNNDNGVYNAGTDMPLANVAVVLYSAGSTVGVTAPVATTTTNANGYYYFDQLTAGDYFVHIPASNFASGQPLFNKESYPGADNTDNTDNNDNGGDSPVNGGISSNTFTLTPNAEPTGETQTDYPGALDDNNVNGTIDFTFRTEKVAVGNYVFMDNNDNGVYNAGTDMPLANVAVVLYASGATVGVTAPVATTTTNANGYYYFDNLTAGDYFVHIPASNFASGQPLFNKESYPGADNTDNTDNNDNGGDTPVNGGTSSNTFTLTPNAEPTGETQTDYPGALDDNNVNGTIDFTFRTEKVAVGNYVFMDNNDNGVYNAGTDMPLANVAVVLYASGATVGVTAPIATTTTNANGYYYFDQLTAGDYFVHIPASNFASGQPLFNKESYPGADNTDNTDNNDNGGDSPVNGGISSNTFTLTPNAEPTGETQTDYPGVLDDNNVNGTIDFTFRTEKVAVGNYVFMDNNDNGTFESGTDMAIPNVAVHLYAAGATVGVTAPVATTTTNANGYYYFDQLTAGDYFVHIPASNFASGQPLFNKESYPGADNTNNTDNNDNGGDTPVNGGTSSNTFTLTPNAEPTGETQTDYPGALDDNNVNGTIDFTFRTEKVAVGNYVFMDNNDNGVYNAGTDMPLANVAVVLYSAGSTVGVTAPVATTTTNANGYYYFDNLTAGDYFVHIPASNFASGQPLFNKESYPGADNTNNTDNNDNGGDSPVNGGISSNTFTLTPNAEPTGETQTDYPGVLDDNNVNGTIDFTFRTEKVAVGNYVFMDNNDNGVYNAGTDMPLANVAVVLYSAGSTVGVTAPIATTTTNANGYYYFDQLTAGDYFVHIPASNFASGQPLFNKESYPGADNTDNTDNNDNGGDSPVNGGISSNTFTLTPNAEPTGETQTDYPGVLDDNNVNGTIDFTFRTEKVAVGNYVFMDNNDNGTFESGTDMPLANVAVVLYSAGSTVGVTAPVATTTTNANGYYYFDQLTAGDYFVHIPASNFASGQPLFNKESYPGADNTNNTDNNDNGGDSPVNGGISSNTFTLTPNAEPTGETQTDYPGVLDDNNVNGTIDFTFRTEKVAVGNYVFMDNNDNGVYNAGTDMPLANVAVVLYSAGSTVGVTAPIATTTTNANGYYYFDQLTAGDYFVHIPASNFASGQPLFNKESYPGADNTDNTDNNDNGGDSPVNGGISSNTFTLTPNAEPTGETQTDYPGLLDDNNVNGTIDFTFRTEKVAVGNYVFMDNNDNGTFESGTDMPLANVAVVLYSAGSTVGVTAPIATTTTNANGYYYFDQLTAGDYFVHIPASNFASGQPLFNKESYPGADNTNNTDNNDNGGDSPVNGGISSNTFTLTPNAEPTGETQTDYPGVLDDNNVNGTIDFTFRTEKVAVGNYVFMDNNDNGVYNAGTDMPLANVAVVLYSAGSTVGVTAPIATTTTNANGYYYFDQLTAGDYFVHIPASNFASGQPLFNKESYPGADNTDNTDNNDNGGDSPVNGGISSNTFTLTPNAEPTGETPTAYTGALDDDNVNETIDFTFRTEKVAVGNYVFMDNNDNGVYNAGTDMPLANVAVVLYASGATVGVTAPVATTTTNVNGYYYFDQLTAGDYFVHIPASNFASGQPLFNKESYPGADNTDNTDNNDNGGDTPVNGGTSSNTFTLTPNAEPTGETPTAYTGALDDDNVNETIDFTFRTEKVAVGNYVFMDNNDNGVYNAGTDMPLANVAVVLYASGATVGVTAPVATTTTNANGYYYFDQLTAGDYFVHIPASNFASGQPLFNKESYPGADNTDNTDNNDNGGDSPVNGGTSSNTFTLTPNAEPTGETPTAYTGALDDDNVNETIDFTFRTEKVAVGNYVFMDNNDNGVYNAGTDMPLANVAVVLYASGATVGVTAPVATTTTNVNGYYYFDNLTAGDYFVHIPASNFASGQPLFNKESYPGADNTDNTDNNDNGGDSPVNGGISSNTFTLTPNAEPTGETPTAYTGALDDDNVNETIDFTFRTEKVAVGNYVFMDNNDNGVYNAGTDMPLANVAVVLYASGATVGVTAPVATTTTNANGYYYFDQLTAGDYFVHIPASNFASGQPLFNKESYPGADNTDNTDNNDNGGDSPVNGGTSSNTFTLTPNAEPTGETPTAYTGALDDDNVNETIDFTFRTEKVAVGNYVFMDNNDNGVYNAGTDMPLANVAVVLYASGATVGVTAPIATTTTNANGYYYFDQLTAGDYFVHIPASNFASGQPLFNKESYPGADNTDNTDNNDNGGDSPVNGGTSSNTFTLTPNAEPTGETPTAYTGALDDDNVNETIDFTFRTEKVAVGNYVFMDNNDNGVYNAGTDMPLANVAVVLYASGATVGVTAPVATTTTNANGYYYFDQLTAGDYFVHIPASNFASGQPLFNKESYPGADNTDNTDNNDNGGDSPVNGGISSNTFTLTPNAEPTGETPTAYTGALDDDNVNETIDFTFRTEKVAVGNYVFMDNNDNGVYNAGTDMPLANVAVVLYASGATVGVTAPVATTTTNANGYYYFDQLTAGDYFVHIPASNFASGQPLFNKESYPGADNTDNTDNNDNGGDTPVNGGTSSNTFTLTPNAEPTGETPTAYTGALDDDNVNETIDFTFRTEKVAVGNYVFMDNNDNGVYNAGTDMPLANVAVVLYASGATVGVTAPIATTTTNANGYYYFDQLTAGDYFVHIPASNFASGQPLFNKESYPGADNTDNTDNNDNGGDSPVNGGISSNTFTLTPNAEPTGETPTAYTGALDDDNVNETIDFTFRTEKVAVGSYVFMDVNDNGTFESGTDMPIAGVTVQLYAAGDVPGTDAPVATTSTNANGYYYFDNLTAGDYFVHIPASNFASGQPLQDKESYPGADNGDVVDNNDNGQDTPVNGGISSNTFTLTPNAEPTGETQTDYSGALDDNNVNGTIDFTFAITCRPIACVEVKIKLDNNCERLITPEMVLAGSNLITSSTRYELLVADINGQPVLNNLVTGKYAGQRLRYLIKDRLCPDFFCWGEIVVEDGSQPKIVRADFSTTPVYCFDTDFVLNNPKTVGNLGVKPSPRQSPAGTIVAGTVADEVLNLGIAEFTSCDPTCRLSVKWSDRLVTYGCDSLAKNGLWARIYRTWVATSSCNGMSKDIVQVIELRRPALDEFGFVNTSRSGVKTQSGAAAGATNYDWVVEYNNCSADKSLIQKGDWMPRINSTFHMLPDLSRQLYLDQVECNYSVQIKDTEFPICGGKGVKIDRELYIFDWCAGGIIDTLHILIKIGDFEAPSLKYAHHAPNVLSTGPMDCTAAFPINAAGIKSTFGVEVTDNCGVANVSVRVKTKDRYVKGILVAPNTWEQVEYAVMNGVMTGLPVGRHRLIIDAYDGCYNAKRDSFEFEVVDKIAPVMKCDDDLHVTLSNANGYTNGYAQVTAADIDEGSWDNCKLAWVRVRRNVPDNCTASFIAKGYDSNGNGKLDPMPADGDWTKADGFDINGDGDLDDFGETFILKDGKLMTPLQDIVEFFCCDLTERVTIELWGEDASGNRNFCWNDLLLEDKVAPTCVAPWDLTIDCDDKGLEKIDDRAASSAIWGDVTVSSGADCAALDIVYSTVKKLKCGAGYIDRIWTLTKQTTKGPITISCTQRITIRAIREYNICFPKDVSSDCKTPIIDTVLTDELGCDILAVNVMDKRYDASDDECYKIFRTYTVINWCVYDDRCGDPMADGNVYVVNRGLFENYGKDPIYVLVRDNDRDGDEEFFLSKNLVVNEPLSSDSKSGDYHVLGDPDRNGGDTGNGYRSTANGTMPVCTATGEYYHSFMYTQIIKVYDSERPVVTGKRDTFCTDPAACSASITKVVTIKDNCTDKVELERQMLMIAPFQTLDAGKMIMYTTPRWSVKDLSGGQFEIKVSNLPEGLHDLIVVGRDECGNLSVATRIPFLVKDCKSPAPICINGLSTELMPDGTGGGMMAVWASDFVASKIYDCNGQGPESKDGLKVITKYSINRVGQAANVNQTSLNLTCADAGKTVLVELHAWDEAGNHDFCVTYIEVQDNRKVCPSSVDAGEISGLITTDELEPVLGVNVDLSGGAQMNQNTGSNGVYLFGNLTKGSDYTVSPQLDKDHLNGVSTFDLVFIQKHILGVKAIDNPYRLIAADVNNSKSISTLDMIQIRKLILNIDTKFTSVPSWKFVDATYKFPDPSNPWSAQFPEVANVNDLEGKVKADFIAVKMGDVNGNASVNGSVAVETRSDKAMIISTDEQQLQKGENYTIVFKAKDLAKIQGYQFTLSIDPSLASIEGIDYTGVMKAENFGIFAKSGMITTSFVRAPLAGALPLAGANAPVQEQPQGLPLRGDEILFTLKLKAESNTALSRALHLNSRLTNMEAYNQSEEVMGVQLAFGAEAVAERAALRQNVPNPFSEETMVGFYLPVATKAVLTIRDVKGALIYRVEGNYAKGNNQVILKKNELGASGILYYTLQTSDFTDTKKMVVLQQ